MGKFREFLINEEIGLADLGQRIEKLFNGKDLGNQIGGALTHPAWSTSDTIPTRMPAGQEVSKPGIDLTVPSVERTGRITCLMLKKNPIYIRLSDGTECNFSYDEYRRIEGRPELGKTMTVIFQRHPHDSTQQYSKIDKAIVRE